MNLPALLQPYISGLSAHQLAQVSTYLDLLLRWNAKTNLTSIRTPEQIVTRHFGESFFLASQLFPSSKSPTAAPKPPTSAPEPPFVITSEARDLLPGSQLPITNYQLQICDLGSGAGFPAIPLLILHPDVTLTLVEVHHTKAVFLREVLRAVHLNAEVKNVRAETLPPASADIVTLRAVEKFDSILPTAAQLVRTRQEVSEPAPSPFPQPAPDAVPAPIPHPPSPIHGLALLISSAQIPRAVELLPNWRFHPPIPIPKSHNRVIQLIEPN